MQFTETSDPTSINPNKIYRCSLEIMRLFGIMKEKSIAHPRHYSIVGYDKTTGERVVCHG